MKRMTAFVLILAVLVSMAACGAAPETKDIDLHALYEGYADRLPAMMVLDETTMLNFLGIRAEDCSDFVAAICLGGLEADEIWLIKAKDEAALESLKQLAETRMNAKLDETVSYNPEQYAIVQKGEILTNGLYLAFLVSPHVDSMMADFENAFN